MVMVKAPTLNVLSEAQLDRFGERAGRYDAENRFFTEDLAELRESGYLLLTAPVERGGLGANLQQACAEQRRLARRAPATALAVTMHLYWGGLAGDLYRAGDHSLTWLLDEIVAGEVFAVGRGERGSDLPLVAPTTRAERVEGGWLFTGHKVFGSMSSAWTRLGIEGIDTADPAAPRVVHAFLPRDTTGYSVVQTWDAMGMRATRSDDTLLEGAFVPDRYVARVVPAGWAGVDAFVLGILGWGNLQIASVYLGLADRALQLAVEGCTRRTSTALGGRTLAHHPMLQYTAAEMAMELQVAEAVVERAVEDWTSGVEHGERWAARIAGAKHRAALGCQRVVDLAMELSGGAGMFRGNELERLYRDVRCASFHPPNPALAHELIGKTTLGLFGTQPRW
jgi:alkylation response protein AidB-like acyl-CoA dehydrogenase